MKSEKRLIFPDRSAIIKVNQMEKSGRCRLENTNFLHLNCEIGGIQDENKEDVSDFGSAKHIGDNWLWKR